MLNRIMVLHAKISKKGFQMSLIEWIIALLVLGVAAYMIYTQFDFGKKNISQFTSCDGLGAGEGTCQASTNCTSGVKVQTKECAKLEQICCVVDKNQDS